MYFLGNLLVEVRCSHVLQGDHALEYALRQYEMNNYHYALRELRMQRFKIAGFYHTSTWREHWSSVIQEQLEIMDGHRPTLSLKEKGTKWASLLEDIEFLYLNVAGEEEDLTKVSNLVDNLALENRQKIHLNLNLTIPRSSFGSLSKEKKQELKASGIYSEGEVSTVNALHRYCVEQHRKKIPTAVFYIHNKGGCCSKASEHPVAHWRDLMNAMVLEFPSICLRALSLGYATCGPEYQDAHYSGNFWWTTCDHVAALQPLENLFDAYAAEFFLLRVLGDYTSHRIYGEHCGYNPYHCRVNHYDFQCPRKKYISKILEYELQEELPPNPTASINTTVAWMRQHCQPLRKKPFRDQPMDGKQWWDE